MMDLLVINGELSYLSQANQDFPVQEMYELMH